MRNFVFITLICVYACNAPTDTVPKTHTVVIQAMKFEPQTLQVRANDSIVFINRDILVHDVTATGTTPWNSSPLNRGDEFRIVIQTSTSYYCSIHPSMKGTIEVTD